MHSSNDAVAKEEVKDTLLAADEDHDEMHQVLFVEENEVRGLIALLSSSTSNQPLSCEETRSYNDLLTVSIHRLRTIFDKYLECPTLLDQSLESLIATLSAPILGIFQSWEDRMNEYDRASGDTTVLENDIDIPRFIDSIRYHLSILYSLSKVRGRKYIQRFLPHHVSDVIPVWMALQTVLEFQQQHSSASIMTFSSTVDGENASNMVASGKQHQQQELVKAEELAPLWESIYVLWIWMSTLSLVPFDSCNLRRCM